MLRFSLYWVKAVWALLRTRRKFVHQTTQTDCGVASALTVLNFMSLPGDPVHAVDTMDADRTGTSLDTLRLYFETHYGLEASALSVPANQLTKVRGQVILHMRQMHYVVLLHSSKTGVMVFDPSRGPVHYPAEDFAALYSGYLLECKSPQRAAKGAVGVIGPNKIAARRSSGGGRWLEPTALFILGVASRLLEMALLLCLVVMLFLILNQASSSALLLSLGVSVACALLLLLSRQVRFGGEDSWVRDKQSHLWRSILRTTFRGRDLLGFRGRVERDVAGTVRNGIVITIPRRAQEPATLGAFSIMPVMLCLLSPLLGLVHILYYVLVLMITQLDSIQVCRRSVQNTIGRYAKLTQGRDLINVETAPELIGEVAKWTVIGVAGYSVLTGAMQAAALMFWILTAMQIVATDFKRAALLTQALGAQDPVPDLTGTEVLLREQRIISKVDLSVIRDERQLHINGVSNLTIALQQPDLTVREQRLILAEVVSCALRNLPDKHRFKTGPVRVFAPGQAANQAEFEQMMIAREGTASGNLPALRDGRKTMDQGLQDPILRDLLSCEAGDFPVFWDVREEINLLELQDRVDIVDCGLVGHLTMSRLTVIERRKI